MKLKLLIALLVLNTISFGQTYDSYFLGNSIDLDTNGQGGICLMGGASEEDNAMVWFLERANQGDVLVLRTSGSDGYNDYMLNQLGVNINSVESIVCNSAAASNEAYIHQKIQQAEAIWFAGGDQWNYISYWRNTAIDSLINLGIQNRGLVVGGTSAGMAIQGQYYFSAQNGTVTSATALANPYDSDVTVQNAPFIEHPILQNVITDTHYDSPDRKGRHTAFLARILQDDGIAAKGIAANEYVAICIDEFNRAYVYGDYPNYDEFAYFIAPNCDLPDNTPEDCSSGNPLNWNRNGEALKVYKVPGTQNGLNYFDLSNWNNSTGSGGTWFNWFVDNGTFTEVASIAPFCSANTLENDLKLEIYPNPASNSLTIQTTTANSDLKIYNQLGQCMKELKIQNNLSTIDISDLPNGQYLIQIVTDKQLSTKKITIQR